MSDPRSFRLSSSFLEQFEGQQPEWGPLGYITYKRTYSRPLPEGGTEEFWQTCKRVVEGCYNIQKTHCHGLKLPWDNAKAQRSSQEMFQRMWDFKFLPPGRGLWMMGTDYVQDRGSSSLNNCGCVSTANISTDFADPFCWMMDMLMMGVGIGFDTKGADSLRIVTPRKAATTFVVEDSREGWVALLRAILGPFAGSGALPSEIDYSKVRPYGSTIAGFGGTASGPQPLMELVESVVAVLTSSAGERISSSNIVDIATLIGRCVVAGNVRRSALISFGEVDDKAFLDLKDPSLNQEALMHHRWAANNSILASVGMDYSDVASRVAVNGEPGIMWLDTARAYGRLKDPADNKDRNAVGGNPCLEQTLHNKELCCLVETFPSRHETYADFKKTLKYAYLYAKTVTLIPTQDNATNQIILKNRRIGTSMSGITQAIERHGRRQFFQWCDAGYEFIKDLDKQYSDWLCIRESIKVSSVKPSGSISLLPGVTPGIHHPHSEFYLRRIRFQKDHPLVTALTEAGVWVEDDSYSPNTVVAAFPVREEYFAKSKNQVTVWEQLELAAQMQHYWADNQVSVTVTFSPEEASDIKACLEYYETRLKGVSFLPRKDHGYVQAPYEEITKEQYEQMVSKIDQTAIFGAKAAHDQTDKFCDGDVCVVK